MAVLLCKSDGKPVVPSLDQKKYPKIVIRCNPSIAAPSLRSKVVNRSENQYACEEQTREEAWREAYQRYEVFLYHLL